MGETHPATLARPEIAAPIGDLVAMFIAEIVDEHFLNPRGKGIDTRLTNVKSNIIKSSYAARFGKYLTCEYFSAAIPAVPTIRNVVH
jgi:hypothetical protein